MADVSGKGFSFRMLGFPVLYRWSALVLPAWFFLAIRDTDLGLVDSVVLLVALVLGIGAAVLLHELGHALTARHFGGEASIEIFLLGGLTRHTYDRPLSSMAKILVSGAGTAAGLAVGVPVLLWLGRQPLTGAPWQIGLNLFILASVIWGVFNLLPLPGLDGAHILDAVVRKLMPERAGVVVPVITTATAVAAIVGVFLWQGPFAAFWLALIFGPELLRLGENLRRGRDEPLYESAVEAENALLRGEFETALSAARDIEVRAASQEIANAMKRVELMALMRLGRHEEILALEGPDTRLPPMVKARALAATGRLAEAEAALRAAPPTADTEALLAEVLVIQDLDGRAAEVVGGVGARNLMDRALELEGARPDLARRLAGVVAAAPRSAPVEKARAGMLAQTPPRLEGLGEGDRWLVEAEWFARSGAVPPVEGVPLDLVRSLQDRLHASGRHAQAAELAKAVGEALDADGCVTLARSLARLGDRDGAFEALARAVDQGFRNTSALVGQADLADLVGGPRWRELVERMETPDARTR